MFLFDSFEFKAKEKSPDSYTRNREIATNRCLTVSHVIKILIFKPKLFCRCFDIRKCKSTGVFSLADPFGRRYSWDM